ncbi:MAG: aminotransferase class IV [Planctomycetota bacterium]
MAASSKPAKPASAISETWAFHNDHWVRLSELGIGLDDLGFVQAVTAVERLRTYAGEAFQVDRHLQRWRATLAHLAIDVSRLTSPPINELLRRNADWVLKCGDVGITVCATPGPISNPHPNLFLHLSRLDLDRVRRRRSQGQPLWVTDVVQPPEQSWSRHAKVRCRLHYYLADRQAAKWDLDAAGLLIDADHSITETSIANLAAVVDNTVIAPPADQVLRGVSAQVVQNHADKQGVTWEHRRLSVADLESADEILLMGTDSGLWWVNRLGAANASKRFEMGTVYRTLASAFPSTS